MQTRAFTSRKKSIMQEIRFSTNQTQRLDEFLRKKLPAKVFEVTAGSQTGDISNSKIRRLILAGAVHVNGRPVLRPAFELRGNSSILVRFEAEKFFYEKQPDDLKIEVSAADILFEDENLIFLNKPHRFPVEQTITGNRNNLHDSLVDFLWHRSPELRNPPYVGIMHRLDRETSGVILFTKSRSVNAAVSEMFQKHNLTKQYLAVVEDSKKGISLDVDSQFTVEMFMGRLTGKSQQGKWGQLPESRGGQYSKTDFRVLKRITVEGRPCLLIECTLYTGRTHQIRVHLASRGLPILGDQLYGGSSASRLYLHAARLAFSLEGKTYDVTSSFNNFL